jgi:hypothetical protein
MFIRVINDVPEIYNLNRLSADYPNVSFPQNLKPEILIDFNIFPATLGPVPRYDKLTAELKLVPMQVNEEWRVDRKVVQLPEELARENVKKYRNKLLAECDWTQVPDSPCNKQAWAEYRNALRAVPEQVGFPFNVVWPVEPI